ncbi:hypothetical protein DDZ13_03440 [Coraliomargarita sinensis]|uniref:Uncharacterized protein n=1 Tax=Coraliomargarita sinensis TaxID=2174842 RepID=A0A317ZHT1_9BACT|nr:hypothetical protein [Coraliomargarita sinensis]PXA05030.1 hypothetical protein DDZ13_03440 [Coraliomargarita sinensis]
MSDQSSSKSFLPTFLGSLGAILIFALIIFLAYLPHRPEPIDQAAAEERQAKADQARAEGIAKISKYAVKGDGSVQIPVDAAMDLVIEDYNN